MPKNVYRGKRALITIPRGLYEKVEKLSQSEVTSISKIVVLLCLEAIIHRENSEKARNS
jgi:hypothetical protein